MSTIPPPAIVATREEWNDADFDLPDGDPIHASDAESEKEDDDGEEDWDLEMDLGKTGGAKAQAVRGGMAARALAARSEPSQDHTRMVTIRPPLATLHDDDEEDEDAVPTIRASIPTLKAAQPTSQPTIDEDFEDAFALPSDLTQLSLRPLELNHRSSKSSMEWGDKDHTSSSQSSDAYSTLGFADNSPPSTYTSASLPDTETEEEEDEMEDLLDGLVVPSGLFESGHSAKRLEKILETKKKSVITDMRVKIASPDPEDDYESGLVLDDDMELSSSRLLQGAQQATRRISAVPSLRSKSVPRNAAAIASRPQSRSKTDRARSPNYPPMSSQQQLRRLASSPPSPPQLLPNARSQTYSQALASAPTPSSSKSSFLAPKFGSLRGQKSHTGLKAPSPPSTRGLTRKASMPSLSDNSTPEASGSGLHSAVPPVRYNAPTASSKAKSHTNSTSRLYTLDYNVPPTRPSTPSANPTALRLTLPTSSSRLKSRPPISGVFPPSPASSIAPPLQRSTSPLPPPPRPPSASASRPTSKSRHGQTQSLPSVSAAKVLRKPKRQRTYGDGTELDGIDDLPLDREKEGRYSVQPKGYGNRIPGASYGTLNPSLSRRKADSMFGASCKLGYLDARISGLFIFLAVASKTLKRTGRVELSGPKPTGEEPPPSKRRSIMSSPQTRRKPTLIRNLGGTGAPKGPLFCYSHSMAILI